MDQAHEDRLKTSNLQSELERRKSFARWPSSPYLVSELAKQGLFYLGYLDWTQCFSCSGILCNWMPTDNVSEQHKKNFRNCQFARGEYSGNEPMVDSERIRLDKLQREQSKRLASSHGEIADPPFGQQGFQQERFPCLNPMNPDMMSLEQRITTFDWRWPGQRIRASVEQFAKAGLFFLGESDKTKCFYCDGGLQNWEYDDKPWIEHAKWFPGCEFVLAKKGIEFVHRLKDAYPSLNRPVILNSESLGVPSTEVQHTPRDIMSLESLHLSAEQQERAIRSSPNVPMTEDECVPYEGQCGTEIGCHSPNHRMTTDLSPDKRPCLAARFPCLVPKNPHMMSLESRMATFDRSWLQQNIRAPVERMAEAGFFFLGESDSTKCFYCNGGLQNWEQEADPWIEHAKCFPECEFLLRTKGDKFVQQLQPAHTNLNRAAMTAPSSLDMLLHEIGRAFIYLLPRYTTNGFHADSQAIKWGLADLGFSVSQTEKVIYSCKYLFRKKIAEFHPHIPKLQNNFYGFTSGQIGNAILRRGYTDYGIDDLLQDLEDQRETFVGLSCWRYLSREDFVPNCAVRSLHVIPESDREPSTSIEETLKSFLCLVCKRRRRDVVFLPCGHLYICKYCPSTVAKCNICKIRVTGRIEIKTL